MPVLPHKHRLPQHFGFPPLLTLQRHHAICHPNTHISHGLWKTHLFQIVKCLLIDTAFFEIDHGGITDFLDDLLEHGALDSS